MNAPPKVWDTNEAIRFLKTLDEDGCHNVVAIDPETEEIEGRTFSPNLWPDVFRWVEEWQGKRNLYFSVNEPRPDAPSRKLNKTQIGKLRALHLDIDPPKGASQSPIDLELQREAILARIQEIQTHPENFATTIIDSGGGFQCLWKFDPKLDTGACIEAVEAQNRGIIEKFGGDIGTADVSRILRLPGTLNLPTATKRKRGRITTRARIFEDTENTVSLDEMAEWAPPVAASRATTSKAGIAGISIDMSAVEDVAANEVLPPELQDKFDRLLDEDDRLNLLWHGDKSAIGGADTSGSAFGFALASRLRRTGQITVTEYGQILASWEYSSENLDERQIARAWINCQAPSASEEFEAVFTLPLQWVERFDAADIPKRQWLVGKITAKQYVAAIVSPPGVGKTTFLLMLAVAAITGRGDIIGMNVHERTRVLLWNQEDDTLELKRRLLAVMTAFDVKWEDLQIDGKPGLLYGSGVDRPLLVDKRNGDQIVPSPDALELERMLKDGGIGLAIFDPFVEMHSVDENNNVEVAAVTRIFRRIAVRSNCAVMLAHHTRKPPNAANRESLAGDMDTARGAGSLVGVVRMGATLYTLDAATAKKYGVAEDSARKYIRLDDGKANMSLVSGEPRFYQREGVTIGGFGGEEVGVLRPVTLARTKSAAETRTAENAAIRSSVQSLLRASPEGRLPITAIVDNLIETGTIELVAPEALRKRITAMFEEPASFENGDVVRKITGSVADQPGRKTILVADFAENSKAVPQTLRKTKNTVSRQHVS